VFLCVSVIGCLHIQSIACLCQDLDISLGREYLDLLKFECQVSFGSFAVFLCLSVIGCLHIQSIACLCQDLDISLGREYLDLLKLAGLVAL